MISQNVLQIILISIIILVTSAVIQEYQDELIQKINDNIPNLFQFFTNPTEINNNSNNESEKIAKLLQSYQIILQKEFGQSMEGGDNIISKKNMNLAFGYVADLDVYVDALELMEKLGFKNFQPPVFHDNLINKQEIGETFSFYFEKGAGSELFVNSKELFDEIVSIARSIQKKESLGGNASTMAARASKEGCSVILGHAINNKFYKEIFQEKAILVEELSEIKDIHLVLDFYKDQPWNGKHSPRSNRMYLNHDIENSSLSYMDKLHDYIRNTKGLQIDVLGLGGFQLLNHRNQQEISDLMSKLGKEIVEIRQYGSKIHMEMGTFTDHHLLSQLIRYPLLQADSIGLNEQELKNIIQYLEIQNVIDGVISEFEYNQGIEDVIRLVSLLKKYEFKISRVHYHTINMQMICNDIHEWESSELALVKSIIIALQESENKTKDFFEFNPDLLKIQVPENLILPKLDDLFNLIHNNDNQNNVSFNVESPVNCWNPHQSIQCCVAPNIQILHPQKTCGLGDNISSTGLIYHKVKPYI